MRRAAADSALAGRVWRAMFDYLMTSAPQRTRALARRALSPNDSRALFSLDPQQGRTMRSLADQWGCDPSNATWIIDRLEALGLAERRGVENDRRVKLVALTPKGTRTRSALLKEFYNPPPELTALDDEELQTLDRILVKLAPSPAAVSARAAAPRAPHTKPPTRKSAQTARRI